jgi:catechol 2,3-dioxygenase-like lactoylglutathione lyase family enzyme
MIDHISLNVSDLKKSHDFYLETLKPLGYETIYSIEDVASWSDGVTGCGLGQNQEMRLWLSGEGEHSKIHLAFQADSQKKVQEFHEAGLLAGGKCNGAPGPRPQYGPFYYAAFILDPDGNNIEVVYRSTTPLT